MGNVVFYKDSIDTFECDITIEGASANTSKSRLILEFSDRTLLFTGDISDGHVSISIPKLSEISDRDGTATLEVIADQTYFEAWTSPFELKNKKSVAIAEVTINSSTSKVVIENVSKEKSSKPTISKKQGIYTDSCSSRNRQFVSESFGRYKALDKSERKQIKQTLKEFRAKPTVQKWAGTVFNDTGTPYARYCMMEVQHGQSKK
jgi:hypothetical protein